MANASVYIYGINEVRRADVDGQCEGVSRIFPRPLFKEFKIRFASSALRAGGRSKLSTKAIIKCMRLEQHHHLQWSGNVKSHSRDAEFTHDAGVVVVRVVKFRGIMVAVVVRLNESRFSRRL